MCSLFRKGIPRHWAFQGPAHWRGWARETLSAVPEVRLRYIAYFPSNDWSDKRLGFWCLISIHKQKGRCEGMERKVGLSQCEGPANTPCAQPGMVQSTTEHHAAWKSSHCACSRGSSRPALLLDAEPTPVASVACSNPAAAAGHWLTTEQGLGELFPKGHEPPCVILPGEGRVLRWEVQEVGPRPPSRIS